MVPRNYVSQSTTGPRPPVSGSSDSVFRTLYSPRSSSSVVWSGDVFDAASVSPFGSADSGTRHGLLHDGCRPRSTPENHPRAPLAHLRASAGVPGDTGERTSGARGPGRICRDRVPQRTWRALRGVSQRGPGEKQPEAGPSSSSSGVGGWEDSSSTVEDSSLGRSTSLGTSVRETPYYPGATVGPLPGTLCPSVSR